MEDKLKWESFIVDNKINVNDLPEKVKNKIQVFEETYKAYDEAEEENEVLVRDLEAKLHAQDEGIYADLTSYLQQKQKESEDKKTEETTNVQTPPAPAPEGAPQGTQTAPEKPSKPSWRFWM